MIRPRHLPSDAYLDDPVSRLDREIDAQAQAFTMARETLIRVFDWIVQGDVSQRSLRFHLVILCISPRLLPCKYPSASWCAREHGVSRQWACRLQQEFARQLGDRIRFRGQRFTCQASKRKPFRHGQQGSKGRKIGR